MPARIGGPFLRVDLRGVRATMLLLVLPPDVSEPLDPKALRGLGLRARARAAWARLRGGELTPSRAFWSVALGLFIGIQPTPGLHLPAVLALYVPLRLDAALGYLASNISIPPIAPFLWFASLQIGARLLTGAFVPLGPEGARAIVHAPGPLLGALVLGSIVLGGGAGAVGGALAYAYARARAGGRRSIDDAIERTARRFERAVAARGTYYYVRSKLLRDPASKRVASLAPLGDAIDLGCGRGQLAVLLLEAGAAESVRGYDWDEAKVALARRAAEGLSATFERTDLREASLDPARTVLLVDVLHYLPVAEQDALLGRAADLVAPGGTLLVREASSDKGLRSIITSCVEWVSWRVRFNRGARAAFRDVARELAPLLEARGFRCTVEPCWAGTPFSNVLVVATRGAAAPGTRAGQADDAAAP